MSQSTRPVKIKKKDAGHLVIVWDDGHESVYLFSELRSRCPCATCNERPRTPGGFLMADATTPTALEVVGNYALNLTWKDGHSTGIYSYESLRAQCACEVCRGGVRPETG